MNFFDHGVQMNRGAVAFSFRPQRLHERIVAIEKAKRLVAFNRIGGFVGFDEAVNAYALDAGGMKAFHISNRHVFRAARLFVIRQ